MRAAVIGDVHGHSEALRRMIVLLERRGVDMIVLTGDLLDRGPDPLGCLVLGQTATFRANDGSRRRVTVVQGNHEDNYVRASRGLPKPGFTTPVIPQDRSLAARLTADDIAWLDRLPRVVAIHEIGAICVHGGISPRMKTWTDLDADVLRVRYLDEKGQPIPGETTSPRFWAHEYDGRFGLVVFGHESFPSPRRFRNALGVDGERFRRLHAAIIERSDGRHSIETASLPLALPG